VKHFSRPGPQKNHEGPPAGGNAFMALFNWLNFLKKVNGVQSPVRLRFIRLPVIFCQALSILLKPLMVDTKKTPDQPQLVNFESVSGSGGGPRQGQAESHSGRK